MSQNPKSSFEQLSTTAAKPIIKTTPVRKCSTREPTKTLGPFLTICLGGKSLRGKLPFYLMVPIRGE